MRETQLVGILGLLAKEGWKHREFRHNANRVWWRLIRKLPRRQVKVFLGLEVDCLLLQLPLGVRPRAGCRTALWGYLLNLSHHLKVAKLTLGEDGQVNLALELPTDACSLSSIRTALEVLCSYFEHYHREIELLATKPELAASWQSICNSSEDHMEEIPSVQILATDRDGSETDSAIVEKSS